MASSVWRKPAHKLIAMSYAPIVDGSGVPRPEDVREIGCVARIHRLQEVKGKLQFIAQGVRRFSDQGMDSQNTALHCSGRISGIASGGRRELNCRAYAMALDRHHQGINDPESAVQRRAQAIPELLQSQ